eukprot:6635565-Pyramimonas_sp.AAC.1
MFKLTSSCQSYPPSLAPGRHSHLVTQFACVYGGRASGPSCRGGYDPHNLHNPPALTDRNIPDARLEAWRLK